MKITPIVLALALCLSAQAKDALSTPAQCVDLAVKSMQILAAGNALNAGSLLAPHELQHRDVGDIATTLGKLKNEMMAVKQMKELGSPIYLLGVHNYAGRLLKVQLLEEHPRAGVLWTFGFCKRGDTWLWSGLELQGKSEMTELFQYIDPALTPL
jgi:hypothetical protein